MKNLFKIILLGASLLLSACGGDNGEMAGTWRGEPKSWITGTRHTEYHITYNDGKYEQKVVFVYSQNNKVRDVATNVLTRDGEYLLSDGQPFIKIISKDEIQPLSDNSVLKRVKD